MHEEGFGEGEGQADKTSQALAQGVVPSFHMGGLPRLFAHRSMLFVGNDCLIRRPEISETDPSAIRLRNSLPQVLTGPFAPIPDRIGHDLAGTTTQCNPDPHLLTLASHKRPAFIQFEHVMGLGRSQRLAQGRKVQPFF